MKLDRQGRAAAAVALATALGVAALTACGSDENRPGAAAPSVTAPAGTAGCGGKNNLTAEGSTAQANAITVFNQVWGQYCPGKGLAYNPTGSGAGREQFIAGHVDFAGADSPLVAEQIGPAASRCGGNPAWDLPLVFGPIALAYNLPGNPALVVSSDAVAKIFTGKITTWNDPILVGLNPGVALPDTRITPIYRSDSSGTTDNVQKYLTAAAPQSWAKGVGTEFQGGVGEGAAKSSGVIQAVQTIPGAIGYVQKGFADQARMSYAKIATRGGVVPLTNDTAGNAIKAAKFLGEGNDLLLDLNAMYGSQEPGVYPLVLVTYEIVCSKGYDAETAGAIKSFLSIAATSGQAELSSAGYIPLPDKVKERLVAAIDALQ
ncbi:MULTISPECIES: phosphate ABC transporter substrate-binding protein PstS [Mycobacterium]|uniref:phosphate ABC transporter substrate-binding protein PstS n=1 Tax=Mycobacterium TaxID=1763 RepID=UPI00044E795A|nr:phosphate ABC transporter substrate-binding protein PstS [Mycobacterium intracellulare]EUA25344.1 phosphate ABC transporter, phosphate-binding protein PstS [Mycobacterium intracellulare]UGU01987.1 phosphate ABC transporter substrate-binding protein PstS [Mycobacterium intracellulare]BCO71447.1 phosphate-binding protein PstS [Mycobacterium intracellulare]BCO76998.1 phosphate-binding protein PstS [Mycobacterium intracellulare]BCP40690.1 phosphate-binding protein PstS [Mycobacterium intracellu